MVNLSKEERIKMVKEIYKNLDKIVSTKKLKNRLKRYYFYEDIIKNPRYKYYVKCYKRYIVLLNLARKTNKFRDLDKILKLPKGTSDRYLNRKSKPHLLRLVLTIPKAKIKIGYKWLQLRNKMHHFPTDFIKVPSKINNYNNILFVLKQLKSFKGYEHIGKEEAFGYILGMMLSDTSKPKGYSNSTQCLISLTRRYKWNLDIGNNLCKYFKSLGINANRIKDNDVLRDRAPNGEFRWISEKSPFNTWILRTCFGFDKKQTTTFDKINSKWILNSSYNFRKAFLQGLCDGDGSAHNFLKVEISSEPNQDFIIKLLKTFNIKSYIDKDAVSVSNDKSLLICNDIPIFKYADGRMIKLNKIAEIIKNKKVMNYDEDLKRKIILLKNKNYSGGQISEYLFDTYRISANPSYINVIYKKSLFQ